MTHIVCHITQKNDKKQLTEFAFFEGRSGVRAALHLLLEGVSKLLTPYCRV